jgi:signal transduction histidine kinase
MELWQKIFLILAGIGNLSLAVFILSRGRANRINLVFSVFLFCSVLWIVFVYFALYFGVEKPNEFLASFFGKLTFAGGSLTLSSFLVFTEVFPMPGKPDKVKRRMILYYAIGGIACLFSLTPFLQSGVKMEPSGIFSPEFNWGLSVWGLYMFGTVVYGVYKPISKYRKLGPSHEKNQLRYTFVGLTLVGVAALLVNMMMFFFNKKQFLTTVSIGPAMTIFMVMLITFAVVRHRLMDLGVVFRSTLIYSVVITILVSINLVFLRFLNQYLELPAWVSVIFSSTILVLTLSPLKSRIESFMYSYIFKVHRHREMIEDISDNLTGILDLDGLRKVVVDRLVDVLQLENGAVFIVNRDNTGYSMYYSTFGGKSEDDSVVIPSNNLLVKRLLASKRIVLMDEAKRTLKDDQYKLYEEEFRKISATALLPLMIKDALIGIVALGSKRSKDIYSYEDVDMLSVLGNHMATALENSRLFDEILALRNHYGSILQHLRSGVVTMQFNKRIGTMNQRAKNILNLGDEDLVGQPIERLGKTLANIMINRQTTRRDFFDQEVSLDIPGRGDVPLGIICTVMKDKKGPAGVLMVIDDLTVEKQLQEKIRRTDKLASVGTLAAGMAHEIKNPLVSIKTFAQLLPERFDDVNFREKFSSITFHEVERINHIVEQLLNFARPMKPNLRLFNVHNVLNEVIAILEGELQKSKVEIIKNFVEEPAIVAIDVDQMKQVLLNLLQNSIQAMDKKGRILVKTQFMYDDFSNGKSASPAEHFNTERTETGSEEDLTNRRLVITILDNGKGIPKELMQNLFDPFFTTRSEGFGLGLAIVHGIVEEHHSTIQIESEEGKWTRVTIKMPADKKIEEVGDVSIRP